MRNLRNSLKKAKLLKLIQHYKFTTDSSLRKSVVLKHLVDEEIIPAAEETARVGSMSGEELLQLKWLEFEEARDPA